MALIQKRCSHCNKVSWTNVHGNTQEAHLNPVRSRWSPLPPHRTWLPCDTNGGTYIDGIPQ